MSPLDSYNVTESYLTLESKYVERPVAGATAALEAYFGAVRAHRVGYSRDAYVQVLDDSGRYVPATQLLGRAEVETASNPAAGRRITTLLADYLVDQRNAAKERAWEHWSSINESGRDLLFEPDREVRVAGLQRNDQQRARLAPIQYGDGAWKEAGLAWAELFGSDVPQAVIDELSARPDIGFSTDQLQAGVQESVRAIERGRAERTTQAASQRASSPPNSTSAGLDSQRGSAR